MIIGESNPPIKEINVRILIPIFIARAMIIIVAIDKLIASVLDDHSMGDVKLAYAKVANKSAVEKPAITSEGMRLLERNNQSAAAMPVADIKKLRANLPSSGISPSEKTIFNAKTADKKRKKKPIPSITDPFDSLIFFFSSIIMK